MKLVEEVKNNRQIYQFDEAKTKQAIILRLLNILGWDVFNINEVKPEHFMEGKRVDFALMQNSEAEVFIEAKKVSEELDIHEEQLLSYSFKAGVKLAILTNGIAWWFYLPLKERSWDQRKFYTIDLLQQDAEDIALKFIELLSKENVVSGYALEVAEKMHEGQIRKIEIEKNMSKAWNKIISEPDELLVELLKETVEKLSGFEPDESIVKGFLKENVSNLLVGDSASDQRQKPSLSEQFKSNLITSRTSHRTKRVHPKVFPPPDGTMCRFKYKRHVYEGIIRNGRLRVNGIDYYSFSAASQFLTNTSRNGWRDWELKLPNSNKWVLAEVWRKERKEELFGKQDTES